MKKMVIAATATFALGLISAAAVALAMTSCNGCNRTEVQDQSSVVDQKEFQPVKLTKKEECQSRAVDIAMDAYHAAPMDAELAKYGDTERDRLMISKAYESVRDDASFQVVNQEAVAWCDGLA